MQRIPSNRTPRNALGARTTSASEEGATPEPVSARSTASRAVASRTPSLRQSAPPARQSNTTTAATSPSATSTPRRASAVPTRAALTAATPGAGSAGGSAGGSVRRLVSSEVTPRRQLSDASARAGMRATPGRASAHDPVRTGDISPRVSHPSPRLGPAETAAPAHGGGASEEELNAAKQSLEQEQASHALTQEQLSEANSKIDDLTAKSKDLASQKKTLERQLESLNGQLRDLQGMQSQADAGQKEILDLTNANNRLITEVRSLKERIGSLELEVESLEIDKESLMIERDSLATEKEISELEALEAKQTAENTTLELSRAQQELQLLKSAVSSHSNDNNTDGSGSENATAPSSGMIEVLQSQLKKYQDALRVAYTDLQREKAKTSRLESAIKSEERNNEAANQRIAQLQEILPQLELARADINDLKQQLDQARKHESMVERLTAKNLDKDEKIKKLEAAVADLEDLYETSNSLNDELEHMLKDSKEENQAAQADILNLQQDLKRQQGEIRELEHQNMRFRTALQNAQHDIKMTKQAMAEMNGTGEEGGKPRTISAAQSLELEFEANRMRALQNMIKIEQFTATQSKQHVEVIEALLPDSDFFSDKEGIRCAAICFRALFKAHFAAERLESHFLTNKAAKISGKDFPHICVLATDVREVTHLLLEVRHMVLLCDHTQFVKLGKYLRLVNAADAALDLVLERVCEDAIVSDQKALKAIEEAMQALSQVLNSDNNELSKLALNNANNNTNNNDNTTNNTASNFTLPHMPLRWGLQRRAETAHTQTCAAVGQLRRITCFLDDLFDVGNDGVRARCGESVVEKAKTVGEAVGAAKGVAYRVADVAKVLAGRTRVSRVVPNSQILRTLDNSISLLISLCTELTESGDELHILSTPNVDDTARVVDAIETLHGMFVAGSTVPEALVNVEGLLQSVATAMVNGELHEALDDQPSFNNDTSKSELWGVRAINERVGSVKVLLGNNAKLEEQLDKLRQALKQAEMNVKTTQVNVRDAEHRAVIAEEKLQALRLRAETAETDAQKVTVAIEKAKKLEEGAVAQAAEIRKLTEENDALKKKLKTGARMPMDFDANGENGGEGQVAPLQPLQEEIHRLRGALKHLQHTKSVSATSSMLRNLNRPSALDEFSNDSAVVAKLRIRPSNAVISSLKYFGVDGLSLDVDDKASKDNADQATENTDNNANKAPAQTTTDDGDVEDDQKEIAQQLRDARKDLKVLLQRIESSRFHPLMHRLEHSATDLQAQRQAQLAIEAKAIQLRSRIHKLLHVAHPSHPLVLGSIVAAKEGSGSAQTTDGVFSGLPSSLLPVKSAQPVGRLWVGGENSSAAASRVVPLRVTSVDVLRRSVLG